ncbi:hypothetical protein K440DRAFT_636250 [Wilcoxina mikolae CBS 423.85]|nr:hypothetical protein K440DRAFT_636250 [Wilcoxina mikolae CBS 423.85]
MKPIGLVSLFTSTLNTLDRLSSVKSYNKDYRLFVTKVNIERVRFFRWGQEVGLAAGGTPHELLQDPEFVDKLHELVPTSRIHRAITSPGVPEQFPPPSPTAAEVLHLAGRSRVTRAGGIQRRKKKHVRRIAATVAKDTERKIRVDER